MKIYAEIVYPFLTLATPEDFMKLFEVQILGFKLGYHYRRAIAWNQGCNSNQLIIEKHCE